jgi:MFS family permease
VWTKCLGQVNYAWIVVAGSVVVLAIYAITISSFGIFLKPVTSDLGWERGAFSLAMTIALFGSGLLGILSGRLSDKHGPRFLVTAGGLLVGTGFLLMSRVTTLWQVYLIYGFLIAVGASALFVPIVSTIPRWFSTKHGLAIGLTFSGMAIGGMMGPLLAQFLISSHGWRGGYVALGLVSLVLMPLVAQVLRHSPGRIGAIPYGESQSRQAELTAKAPRASMSLGQAMRTSRFWLLGSMLFCALFIHQTMMAHLPPHAIDIGIAPAAAAILVSVMGGASLVGRILAGFLSDRAGARFSVTIWLLVTTLALVWLLLAKDLWTLFLFAAIYGIVQGGFLISHNLTIGNLFGPRNLGAIFASVMVMGLLGASLGAPVAGSIYDNLGNYDAAFVITLVLGAVALILSFLLLRAKGANDGHPRSPRSLRP